MTTTPKNDTPDLSTEAGSTVLVDMSDHANVGEGALRIEMRRIRAPSVSKAKTYEDMVPDDSYIIGLLETVRFPVDGKVFEMPYHIFNGLQDFGVINSLEPVTNVAKSDDGRYTYFSTTDGEWRLEILNAGN